MRNVNVEHREQLTKLEKLALFITRNVGSMGFFIIIVTWTAGWLLWNTLSPAYLRFDPFPAFVLWLFISNMIQIMLMPLILVGQNLSGRHAAMKAEMEFEINKKSEQNVEEILKKLGEQNNLIIKILTRLEGEK